MMNISDINKITQKYGRFSLEDYFRASGNLYAIYLIDYENQIFIFQDGFENKELDDKCNEGFSFERKSISALYGQRSVDGNKNTIDVIMIDNDLLDKDKELVDLLIFHEVYHLIEKTGYIDELKIGRKMGSGPIYFI